MLQPWTLQSPSMRLHISNMAPLVPRRALKTGLVISRLGFGVSGPHGAALVPEALTQQLIHQALEGGANLFDTAPFYGNAEARLGRALKSYPRDRFLLSTKLGKRRQGTELVADFSPAALRAQVDSTLACLGVENVDILFLHGPPADLADEARKAFLGFKTEGKTRALGICGRGPELEANSVGVDVIMAPCASPWPDLAARLGLDFLGVEAMAAAARWSTPPTFGDVWRLARRLRRGGASKDRRAPEQALADALRTPHIDSVIMTTTNTAHLKACLEVAARDD
jgi:aryl-alcohol dehydrogenase-like predicted oxidoreductase